MDRTGGPAITRRAFLRAVVSGTTLPLVVALVPVPAVPARATWGEPLSASPGAQANTQIEVIGARSPFQPFEVVATEPGGFPILGSEILADADVQIDIAFMADWTPGVPGENFVGIQVVAGPEQNSPQRPGLSLNVRKSDNLLLLGHRHGGRTDTIPLGTAPAGFISCRLDIAVNGMTVRVTTPNGTREMTLTESFYILGRSLRVHTSAGNAIERISSLSLSKPSSAFPTDPLPAGRSLRDLASARGMSMGSVTNMWRSAYDARYEALSRSLFNHLTVAGGLHWRFLRPSRDRYFYGWADAELNFAIVNGQAALAQHLIWHDDFGDGLPQWLTAGTFTRDEMIAIMRDHIATVMDHYRGKISRWVVVNEARSPDGFWPRDFWFQRIGPDYVELAFRAAREADSTVELIYNETNAIANKKAEQVYTLARDLKDQGLIDGVGMQMHVKIPGAVGQSWQEVVPTREQILGEMTRYRDLGVSVEITEADVNIHGAPTSPEEKLRLQGQAYADILGAALESDACRRLTMWGFVDSFSWLLTEDRLKGASEAPCIFDSEYQPKPAYFALRDTLAQT